MKMLHRSISKRINKSLGLGTVLLVLAACGGGGDGGGGGNAVSSSPNAPSGNTQVADAGGTQGTVGTPGATTTRPSEAAQTKPDVTPAGNAAENKPAGAQTRPETKPESKPEKPESTTPAHGSDVTESQKKPSENVGADNPLPPTMNSGKLPPLVNGKLSGNALMTMLESRTPVDSSWMPQRAATHFMPEYSMSPVASRTAELEERPARFPAIVARSSISPENYDMSNVSYAVLGHGGTYRPAKGDFELDVRTYVTYTKGVSTGATERFVNMTMSLKGNATETDFTLGGEVSVETETGFPGQGENNQDSHRYKFAMVSEQPKTYSRAAWFPANEPIQIWRSCCGTVKLFWRPGPGARDVDLCWDVDSWYVKRLQCSTWTLQEDWVHGVRFTGGGVYMEDDRSVFSHSEQLENGEWRYWIDTSKYLWRVDGRSIDLFHG